MIKWKKIKNFQDKNKNSDVRGVIRTLNIQVNTTEYQERQLAKQ